MNRDMKECISSRMKIARESAGLSQGQVAKLVSMHRPTISQIEANERRVSADELKTFAGIYKVSVSWLACADAEAPDENRDRVELAARELSKLHSDDLDRVMSLLVTLRSKEKT